MMAYLDENGNLTAVSPDNGIKLEINADDIEIGVPKRKDPGPEELRRNGIVTYFNA